MAMKIKTIKLEKKEDARGSLIQNESPEIRNRMKHFFVSASKNGVIRGQHYHTKKVEWFLVIKGRARIYFEDISTHEKDSVELVETNPQVVEVPVLVAHSIENIGTEEMILLAIVNEPLDKKSPDTFPYKVI